MSTITFRDSAVVINGVAMLASQASISESLSYERRDELGGENVRTVPSQRPAGSFSMSYYLPDSDGVIRGLTGYSPVTGKIGDYGFSSGFMTKYSISVEPNSPIQANLSIDFYSAINRGMTSGNAPMGGSNLAHGGGSIASGVSFNTGLFSFDYEISQSFTPYLLLGNTGLMSVERTNGSISCSLEGSGLADAVAEDFCDDGTGISLNLKTLCGDSIGTIQESGMRITSCDLSIDNVDDVIGKVSLIKYF